MTIQIIAEITHKITDDCLHDRPNDCTLISVSDLLSEHKYSV